MPDVINAISNSPKKKPESKTVNPLKQGNEKQNTPRRELHPISPSNPQERITRLVSLCISILLMHTLSIRQQHNCLQTNGYQVWLFSVKPFSG
jgi:hypothetical protein